MSSWLSKQLARVGIAKSVFFPALGYVNAGVDVLGEEGWASQYDVILELSMMATKVRFNVRQGDSCLDEVKRHHAKN